MSDRDPFKITSPALISFSGGRTSGYMLWRIIQAHGGTLPDGLQAVFCNTGKEMPQTLNFVRDCGERWGVDITWLEYQEHENASERWRQVTYETASRHGEPYSALIARKKALPNPGAGWCTSGLKIEPIKNYALQALRWETWENVVGIRADEPARVARMRYSADPEWDNVLPLVTAKITKADVMEFWRKSNFDLALPPGWGNCDLCWKKSAAQIQGMMRDLPGIADWWIAAETAPRKNKPRGARFRDDRPSYAAMFDAVQRQENIDFGDRDELIDCFCGDAA